MNIDLTLIDIMTIRGALIHQILDLQKADYPSAVTLIEALDTLLDKLEKEIS